MGNTYRWRVWNWEKGILGLTGIIECLSGEGMYAATAGSGVTAFSPRTTSATAPVPEPSTMVLFGTGLACLAGFGCKKFFKK